MNSECKMGIIHTRHILRYEERGGGASDWEISELVIFINLIVMFLVVVWSCLILNAD